MMKRFDWVDFYEELATQLRSYQNKRPAMVDKIIDVFAYNNIKPPKLESGTEDIDMDSFTVFSLFNRRLTDQKRKALCRRIKEVFSLKFHVPEHFDGIPVMNPLNATFYRFSDDPDRGEHDIDKLWECFSAALDYADNECSETEEKFFVAYDKVKDLKGNRWKLTIGLYWIRPKFFLNLDSRNRWYLSDPENIDANFADKIASLKQLPDGKEYAQLCAECRRIVSTDERYGDLVSLSDAAWIVSEEVNQQEKAKEKEKSGNQSAAIGDTDVRPIHYWLYSPGEGACKWEEFYTKGIMGLGWREIGDYRQYASRADMTEAMRTAFDEPASSFKNASLATWQFLHDVKIGDVIFVKQGIKKTIGRGIVESEYFFQQSDNESDYTSFRKVNWTNCGEWDHPWHQPASKTLTDLTQYTDYVKNLEDLFAEDEDADVIVQQYPPYDETDFLTEVYMSYEDYHDLVTLLKSKKNVILQGAPGVGKTYAAKRLAYSIMGEKNQDRVMMVQFHQSYSYEDFVMGFRPNASGFELKYGAFYEFCKKAQDDQENSYFFIIDEINRGNLSKIFGELFMLIENDKRGIELRLLYANEKFAVPRNVHIIGMMNTADRSLAMMDYALRRRFSFFDMVPGFDTDGFLEYQDSLENSKFDRLISCVKSLNLAISQDESLGEGFRIGHSYFSNLSNDSITGDALLRIVKYELVPLLKEYWFDEPQKVKEWQAKLESAVK